jgi:hypothetical protein
VELHKMPHETPHGILTSLLLVLKISNYIFLLKMTHCNRIKQHSHRCRTQNYFSSSPYPNEKLDEPTVHYIRWSNSKAFLSNTCILMFELLESRQNACKTLMTQQK